MDSPARRKEGRELFLYYLYGFSLATEPFALQEKGMERENNVFSLSYHELSAVVSCVPLAVYSEQALNKNLTDLTWLTPRVQRHEQTIKAAMQCGPVIPVRFCTLYKSRARILEVLRNQYEPFRAFLSFARDKEEWGVKIYLAAEAGEKLVRKASPALQALDDRIAAASTGESYFLRKRREQIFREEVERSIAALTDKLYAQLSSWSVAGRRNRVLDRRASGRAEEMICNAAFLLAKEAVGEFVEGLDRLAAHYTSQDLFFTLSGPWPPYNFCPRIQ
ncbi:MAG TPA: GvpL/GvpF family gas vesicle protein [Candidatus Binatia bacterium]|jgi:hypothetical protein|nr:GvpL/GvpF family gas vesicle protein [Candidatus Binatia bacterium]